MHYANGRVAKIGDLVRGKGYNLKHEFTGVLLFANPAASACNCQVATVTVPHSSSFFGTVQPASDGTGWKLVGSYPTVIWHTVEYGQLDAFVALDPDTGNVLPPDGEPAAPALQPVAVAEPQAAVQEQPDLKVVPIAEPNPLNPVALEPEAMAIQEHVNAVHDLVVDQVTRQPSAQAGAPAVQETTIQATTEVQACPAPLPGYHIAGESPQQS